MNDWALRTKYRHELAIVYIFVACMLSVDKVMAEEATSYEFNTGFIVGATNNIDLQRFNAAAISEGQYSVDVYTNNNWKGRYDLNIKKDKQGKLGVCYTPKMLVNFGIIVDKLNESFSKDENFCGSLSQWKEDENVKDIFNPSKLQLNISVPQIYEQKLSQGYIAPEFWEKGIPALNVSYMSNYYNNHLSSSGAQNDSSAFLGVNAGLSVDGWLLKHMGNLSWQRFGGTKWNSNETYLQRAIPTLKSKATAGQFYTDGNLFDSVNLRGIKLATDDNMYPDGVTTYAPEIRGVAQSNALVTVRQGGSIIYQTSVPPGPFNLTDIYPTGYGTDLDVTVKEADGSESSFSVPYASLAQLLRPGFTHYQVAVGQSDADNIKDKPYIYQGTVQHGINNTFTLYSGMTGFDNYQSYLVGSGVNTGIGALALDATQARTSLKNETKNGQNYRLTFNRQITQTNTNILLSTSHSPTKNYYNINDALYSIDYEKRNIMDMDSRSRSPMKNDLSFTVNQNLPDGYGGFYFTGRVSNYWGESSKRKQFQQTYNNRLGRLSYSVSYMRVYSYYNKTNKADNRLSLNLTYPLDFGGKTSTLTSNTIFNDSHFGSSQVGINGSFDQENKSSYGVNTSTASGGHHNVAMNSSYRSQFASVNANYSQGESYRQFGAGANGSVVVHSGGVTLSPNTSNTMILVEAKDAKGASIAGAPGTRIDKSGYALAPYARPYRINTIEVDPKGSSDDIVFENTSSQVVPYEGSVVKVKFDTKIEKNRVFNVARYDGKPLAFGADVLNLKGESIGVVGQGGTVFINNEKSTEAIVKWENGQCQFSLQHSIDKNKVCQ